MNHCTDAELVSKSRAGDKQAFGQLIERYEEMAWRVAARMVANENIARELAQEAMLEAYLCLDRLREATRFRSWLYGIVLNVCRSYLRDQKGDLFSWQARRGGLRSLPWAELPADPHLITEAQERERLVLAAIDGLSPKNRAVTLLFYYEQLSLQEIAGRLGISVVAVKGRLYKARQQLRPQLAPLSGDLVHKLNRRINMIKVEIVDVIVKPAEPPDSVDQPLPEYYVVVLFDEAGRRALPIWVGPWEGQAIAIGLRDFATARPLTFNFMTNLLAAVEVVVEEVRVEVLKDDTFYGVVKLRQGERVQEIDARPSDAMALALRTKSPIYVTEAVMAAAGFDVSQEIARQPRLGQGLDDVLARLESEKATYERKTAETAPDQPQVERSKAQQEVIAQVFGPGPIR
jgi:RNA polymerase sigma factor (sigma-70 family)